MRWALGQNSPEACHMIIGAIGALFAGLQQPAFALVVTQLYGVKLLITCYTTSVTLCQIFV